MGTVVAEEWQRISASDNGISRSDLEAIDERARSIGIRDLLRWYRDGASPQNWIGIIRGGATELQIVPKGWTALTDATQAELQLVLIYLLGRSSNVRLTLTGLGLIAPEPTLLDLLYRLFIDACRFALRRRAVRTYRKFVASGPQMRGSLLFPDQAMTRLVNPAFFVTSWTELTWDNPYNRVLAAACNQVARSRREDLRAAAQLLAASLRTSALPLRIDADRAAARRIRLSREHEHCLRLAELILDLAGGAGLFTGDLELGAQLVSTSRLWQVAVASIANSTPGVVVTAQPTGHYALRRILGKGSRDILELEPDLLVSIPSTGILDTKWKLTEPQAPVLDAADLHQALDYARHFKVSRVVLLYPGFSAEQVPAPFISYETTVEPQVEVAAFQLPLLHGIPALEAAVFNAVRYAVTKRQQAVA